MQDQEQYWHSQNQPYKPVSPKQFSELFKASKIGQEELQHLDSAFEPQAQAFDVSLKLILGWATHKTSLEICLLAAPCEQ